MEAPTPTTDAPHPAFGRPQIIFLCELSGPELRALLRPPVVATLAEHGYGVALAAHALDEATAEAARLLNAHGIPLVARLLPTPADGTHFNLLNYPQAAHAYGAFHAWAKANRLAFDAVGITIEPPAGASESLRSRSPRHLLRRVRHARENGLFAAGRAAFTDLIAAIHHDGYEVHTFQLPILADDRRAGSTLAQRTLDIVDLPADIEVLRCYSSVPLERFDGDIGGALIASYGHDADGIGVGVVADEAGPGALPSLAWDALERDLLLAARHTDTLYIATLEGCVARGLLARIVRLDWDAEPHVAGWNRLTVDSARGLIFVSLVAARFSRELFAWLGWGLFALLLARRLRGAVRGHSG